jgi:hypothetical protein
MPQALRRPRNLSRAHPLRLISPRPLANNRSIAGVAQNDVRVTVMHSLGLALPVMGMPRS